MPRFMALHTISGMTRERFTEALDGVKRWRPDPRTTVVKVYCNLDSGRMVTECEAATRESFEAWLKARGWEWETIESVDIIFQAGNIWDL